MLEIFSAFGLSASAGLNAYLPLLIVAICAKIGVFHLNEPFDVMTSWWVIGVLVVLLLIEVLVDKIPAVDTANDIINTVIRPAAGAILFAASADIVTDLSPVLSVVLGILVAGSVHAVKATARPAVTASTGGVGNPIVSTIEDLISAVTALVSVLLPWLVLLIATMGIVMFLRWRLRRAERRHPSAP